MIPRYPLPAPPSRHQTQTAPAMPGLSVYSRLVLGYWTVMVPVIVGWIMQA